MNPPTRRPPTIVLGPAVLGVALVITPIVGLLQRAPWTNLLERLADDNVVEAIRVSMVVSLVAAAVSTVLGLPLAWLLARTEGRLTTLVRAAVLVPMVLPPVVGGTALLYALGRRGLIGQRLDDWFGITLPFTTTGAVMAATFVALPFFVTTVEAALRQSGPDLEEAAAVSGASPAVRLLTVTVPASRDAILAGVALAWARALGEFGATITFAGNLAGETRTLPLQIFLALETDPESAVAASVLLLVVSLAVLVRLRGRWFRR